MSTTSGPITLFSQWANARKNLAIALSEFHDASKGLGALGSQLSGTQKFMLQSLKGDLPALETERGSLSESMATLKRLCNSGTDVWVNRLPREILAAIFTMAVDDSRAPYIGTLSRPRNLVDFSTLLASVCSHWRQVSVATPALWAHIDFNRRGLDYQALWLERAAKYPLRLRFQPMTEGESDLSSAVLPFLRPYYRQINSLLLDVGLPLGRQILYDACVSSNNSQSKCRSLTLFSKYGFHPCFLGAGQISDDQINGFLGPVCSICLSCTDLGNWTSTAFHNLVDLSLHHIEPYALPTYDQLVHILRSSPNLFSLKLSDLTMPPVPRGETTPIILEKLALVSLLFIPNHFVSWFLKLLVPRQEGLTLALSSGEIPGRGDMGWDLPLLYPSRVKALCLNSSSIGRLDLSKLLAYLPRLENLALLNTFVEDFGSALCGGESQFRILRTLDLVECPIIDPSAFEAMLAQHSVSQLWLSECRGAPSAEELRTRNPGLVVNEGLRDLMENPEPFGL
jgi:hypothetical protein